MEGDLQTSPLGGKNSVEGPLFLMVSVFITLFGFHEEDIPNVCHLILLDCGLDT